MAKKKNSKARDAKKLRNTKKRTVKVSESKSAFSNKKKNNGTFLSFCGDHGPYTADNLCACYDETGKLDGKTYLEEAESSIAKGEATEREGFCPLHGGPIGINEEGIMQCGCFDKSGNRIKTPTGESIH